MPPKLGTQGGETKLKTEKSRDLRSKYRTLNDKLRSKTVLLPFSQPAGRSEAALGAA